MVTGYAAQDDHIGYAHRPSTMKPIVPAACYFAGIILYQCGAVGWANQKRRPRTNLPLVNEPVLRDYLFDELKMLAVIVSKCH
jgi:hypothetical protein